MNTDAAEQPDPPAEPDLSHPKLAQAAESPQGVSLKPPLDPRGLIQALQKTSPTFRDYKPVALRIDKAVMARFPELDRKIVRTAMRMHTASTRYLKTMEKATHRYDLEGNEAGEITDEHRAHATQTLKERFAEAAKRKREQQKADDARRQAEEAEQRKTEKLQQLMSKFSSR